MGVLAARMASRSKYFSRENLASISGYLSHSLSWGIICWGVEFHNAGELGATATFDIVSKATNEVRLSVF